MMKRKIAILGSTGSIGKSLLKIISKEKNKFDVVFLSAKKNYKELFKQARLFNVKNIIITDKKKYVIAKKKISNNKINIFNNFDFLEKIFYKKKIDYVMSSIVGLEGLYPTIKIIKFTKKIAIANKESIICAWNLINKQLQKYNTKFIPVDSEHFSIWYALKNNKNKNIEKIFLTASGGPLLNIPISRIKNLGIKQILKHPNWKMGKKITVDSSTMMNKVFEIIEAKNIFNVKYSNIGILIHPESYLHAIVKFNDGMVKLIAHDTTMDIPIFNSINEKNINGFKTNELNLNKLNNLNLVKIDKKKFPLVNILKLLPAKNTLFETVLVAANDELVKLYLDKKIKYLQIQKMLTKIISLKEFNKYKLKHPKNISEILNLSQYVRLKINSMRI